MSAEFITSTGLIGRQLDRSFGRAYWNVEETITNARDHLSEVWDFQRDAYFGGRRRWVIKGRYTHQAEEDLIRQNAPIEAKIPLNLFDSGETDSLLYLGNNFHRSEIPEWREVLDYWRYPNGCDKTPFSRIAKINSLEKSFSLTSEISSLNVEDLVEIWKPFGWRSEGVVQLREKVARSYGVWFSGVVDRRINRLVSACMGERVDLAGLTIIESTEYGTLPEYQGMGLCTSAISFLNAQILRDTLYSDENINPVILAELSMSSRSDIAARHAGFRVPLINQYTNQNTLPFQVLPRNVAVLDGLAPNDLDPTIEHRSRTELFREAYGADYNYWRNFIIGVLPREAIDQFYSRLNVSQILEMEERRANYVSYPCE